MSKLSTKIGLSIREARKQAGLTQAEYALKVGISQAQLSRYENGIDNLSSTQIERLFDVLNMDVEVIGTIRN